MFELSKFRVAKGFKMTFDNGWTVSVQWGEGNYCHNRQGHDGNDSLTAEVAAYKGKEWYVFGVYKDEETGEVWGEEHVKGWMTPDQVLEFMNEIAKKGR